jgi:zinc protease
MIIGRALASGMTLEDVETWPRDLETVTKEEINAAAAKYLDPDAEDQLVITGYLLPEEKAEDIQEEETEE